MLSKQVYNYEHACKQILQEKGIRFVAVINKQGRVVAGGFNNRIIPLEGNEQKREMLFMEIMLDFSMRKEFNDSLGSIQAIVSYRDKVNIITIPWDDDCILLSCETGLDPTKIIQTVRQNFLLIKNMEAELIH